MYTQEPADGVLLLSLNILVFFHRKIPPHVFFFLFSIETMNLCKN